MTTRQSRGRNTRLVRGSWRRGRSSSTRLLGVPGLGRRSLESRRRSYGRNGDSLFRLRSKILAGIDEAIALEIVLLIVELFVPAVGDEQLLMRAVFDNLAAFEHQNLIGAPNRRQPVRDHERRPAAPQGT